MVTPVKEERLYVSKTGKNSIQNTGIREKAMLQNRIKHREAVYTSLRKRYCPAVQSLCESPILIPHHTSISMHMSRLLWSSLTYETLTKDCVFRALGILSEAKKEIQEHMKVSVLVTLHLWDQIPATEKLTGDKVYFSS